MRELSDCMNINEIRQPEVENYKEIKPINEWNPEKARQYWDNFFKNEIPIDVGNDIGSELSPISEIEKTKKSHEEVMDGEIHENAQGLTEAEREKFKEENDWSDEIINHIESKEQYEIYKNAELHETEVNGRKCLIKDIDMDYVDPKTEKTNQQLMAEGRAPYDSETGERIELHHMGQDPNGPFAELCENSEHGDGNHKILHTSEGESWRHDSELNKQYNYYDRPNHWKERSEV